MTIHVQTSPGLDCPHKLDVDYRYIPWAGKRQCRWCGATERVVVNYHE